MTTQYWITGTSGDWSTAADWSLGVVPSSTTDAVINNSSAVTVNGTAVAYSLALDTSTLTVSGTLTLSTSLTVDGNSELALSGGTLSAQSITSDSGTLGELYGYGTVNVCGAVSGDIIITANGGTLTIEGSLSGDTGFFQVNSGATLELSGGTAESVYFGYTTGSPSTLKLDAPAAFTGAIYDIRLGDTIDLAGITASSATYSGTTLTINETNGQQLTYDNVSGSVAGDIITVAGDNNGGTDVYWSAGPPPVPTVEPDRAHVQLHHALSANGVLANDTDPITNDTLSVSAVDGLASNVGQALLGSYGTLTLTGDGSYSYSANGSHPLPPDGVGLDIFTYTADDGPGGSATTTLTIVVTAKNETYLGGTAGATIHGGFGNFLLDGGAGGDILVAGFGKQVLIGGPGDTLTGGHGHDTFVFAPNFGVNTINHFNTVLDHIQLPKSEFANFAAVRGDMQQVGANTVITYDAADVITLVGVHASSLHASDFHFV